ncbi:MAG: glycine cleavage system protein T [Anaerolineae bacterium]|nr:glycine cleavage system protein T [Anaerolineae bacterium]MDW8171441.1 glycine cleavage system protein T [Anaerolineae bacterium]
MSQSLLRERYQQHGARLAQDGIPLDFGDLAVEYQTALSAVVLLDRSHEGRVLVMGSQRHELLNRMSTNHMLKLAPDQGQPTLFTTPTARILERVTAYNRSDGLLCVTLPGHGALFARYLQRNIFFNDDVQVQDITSTTHQFSLHGPQADDLMARLLPDSAALPPLGGMNTTLAGQVIYAARNKPLSGAHWLIICPAEGAASVFEALQEAGARPSGSLLYNVLRIRAGVPGLPELNEEYIPLELGLWDEVSFHKGCYTGQEVIARMESRAKLARTLVRLHPEAPVQAPAALSTPEGQSVGTLTSAVTAPDGQIYAMGVVKTSLLSQEASVVLVGEARTTAHVGELLGAQPRFLRDELPSD